MRSKEVGLTPRPRLTLDTNLLHEFWKQRPKCAVVEELLELARERRVELAVTARVHEDVPNDPLASQVARLAALGIAETGSVTRLDHWVLGRDQLGSDDFVAFENELRNAGRKEPDWRDLDHLHAHMLQGRDVFLTWDTSILALAGVLRDRFGIVVDTPEEFMKGYA